MMHTDYFSMMKPRVRIFSDRMEFENPGAFPRPIEELLRKDVSIPRNPVLAKLFRCAKLADNAGYGFDKMLKWEKSTQTKVAFENSIDVALVTFKLIEEGTENVPEKGTIKGNDLENDLENNLEKGTIKGNDLENDLEKGTIKENDLEKEFLSENQRQIIKLILDNPHITQEELSKHIRISEKNIRINISKLKDKGLIQRIGPDKGGYWKVMENRKMLNR